MKTLQVPSPARRVKRVPLHPNKSPFTMFNCSAGQVAACPVGLIYMKLTAFLQQFVNMCCMLAKGKGGENKAVKAGGYYGLKSTR